VLSDVEKLRSLVFMREGPAVISQPLTALVGVRAGASPCEICVGQSGTETFIFAYFDFPMSVSFRHCCVLTLILNRSLTRTNRWHLGTFQQKGMLLQILESIKGWKCFCPSFKELSKVYYVM